MKSRALRLAGVSSIFAFLGTSVSINVLQGMRIASLEHQLESSATRGDLAIGTQVPGLEVTDLMGQPFRIEYQSAKVPTVLYVFSPSCTWCQRNGPALKELANGIRGHYRLIGISLSTDGVAEFIKAHQMDFPVYSSPQAESASVYHLGATPETIVLSPSGTVLAAWRGAYVAAARTLVEKYFSVHLPDQEPHVWSEPRKSGLTARW